MFHDLQLIFGQNPDATSDLGCTDLHTYIEQILALDETGWMSERRKTRSQNFCETTCGILNRCRDLSRLPDLTELAINVLSLPHSLIEAERIFSSMID